MSTGKSHSYLEKEMAETKLNLSPKKLCLIRFFPLIHGKKLCHPQAQSGLPEGRLPITNTEFSLSTVFKAVTVAALRQYVYSLRMSN